jgi:glyoxylase-like metal-dependent hydrolase (beta-lactamase superfamily II)
MRRFPFLPSCIRFIQRGWLSANSIVLIQNKEAAVIDSGYCTQAKDTVQQVSEALEGRLLTRLINTHGHSDHIGGNAALKAHFGCQILIPAGLWDAVSMWDSQALLLAVADQRGARFRPDAAVCAGDTLEAGGLEWEAMAAPGHDMAALVFYNKEEGLLISGDALWEDGFGIVFPDVLATGDGLGAIRTTLETLARLPIRAILPGHGAPFVDVENAFERAFGRLRAFESQGERMARNAIRACFVFHVLEKGEFRLDELEDYLAKTPIYRAADRRFLGLGPEKLAAWLIDDLAKGPLLVRQNHRLQVRDAVFV